MKDIDRLVKSFEDLETEKQDLLDKLEIIRESEDKVKDKLDSKARKLYGEGWEPIESDSYKISRVLQGSVYQIVGEVDGEFTKQTISLETKKVTDFIKSQGRLPKGVKVNIDRTYRITISLK